MKTFKKCVVVRGVFYIAIGYDVCSDLFSGRRQSTLFQIYVNVLGPQLEIYRIKTAARDNFYACCTH